MRDHTDLERLADDAWHEYGLGQMEAAKLLAEQLLADNPGSANGLLLLASLAVADDHVLEALARCLEAVLPVLPDNENLSRIGSILSHAGQHTSALRFLQRALATREDNYFKEVVIIEMSDCLKLLGKPRAALDLLTQWIHQDPTLELVRSDLERLEAELNKATGD